MSETYQRLSVNINTDTAAILRKVKADQEISATEALRRAIGYLSLVEQLRRDGGRILIGRGD